MGQFEFQTSPMGLLGCPALFQRLMELVMKDIPNVLVYIDDILIHSKTVIRIGVGFARLLQKAREFLQQILKSLCQTSECFFVQCYWGMFWSFSATVKTTIIFDKKAISEVFPQKENLRFVCLKLIWSFNNINKCTPLIEMGPDPT